MLTVCLLHHLERDQMLIGNNFVGEK